MIVKTMNIEVEVDGFKCSIHPETFEDHDRFLRYVSERREEHDVSLVLAAQDYGVILRIDSWEGPVLEDGSPAPCDMFHKLKAFGQYPAVLRELTAKLKELEGETEKK